MTFAAAERCVDGRTELTDQIKCIKVTGKAECANCTQAKSSCTFLLSNQPTIRKPCVML